MQRGGCSQTDGASQGRSRHSLSYRNLLPARVALVEPQLGRSSVFTREARCVAERVPAAYPTRTVAATSPSSGHALRPTEQQMTWLWGCLATQMTSRRKTPFQFGILHLSCSHLQTHRSDPGGSCRTALATSPNTTSNKRGFQPPSAPMLPTGRLPTMDRRRLADPTATGLLSNISTTNRFRVYPCYDV